MPVAISVYEAERLKKANTRLQRELSAANARNATLQEEIGRISRNAVYDELTGLLRRGFFEEELKRLLSLMAKGRHRTAHLDCVSVVFLDIDDFKSINDTYGHPVGDAVLKAVADAVRSALRQGDRVCRWGGEEMVVLLVGASKSDAMKRAESIRQSIAGIITFAGYPTLRITASFGVATASSKLPASAEGLVRRADEAMYRAKGKGKNRVVAAL